VVRNAAKLPKNDNLTAMEEDVAHVDAFANIAKGKDAVVSAYSPGWTNPDIKRLIVSSSTLQLTRATSLSRTLPWRWSVN